ncbi:MAG TPA: hypothetical protein VEY07_02895, partial [Thermoplasmata archaeon]|nr:hypothetical protein [Thermoplasmata archaeon]
MVRVTFTPEAIASFRRLPGGIRNSFDALLVELDAVERLRLPGRWPTHQLEGGRDLWTLKVGRYRGIFRWDG